MGLRLKFNLILILSVLIGLGAAAGLTWRVAQDNALEEVQRDIDLIRRQAQAVRYYTATGITPLLADDAEIIFAPHSVPSFAAQTVFQEFQAGGFDDYEYKEASDNPTNPSDLATPFEQAMLERLRTQDSLDPVRQIRDLDGTEFLTVAFPIPVGSEACLRCHSTPDVAPAAMVDLYGETGGYGWNVGEITAAQFVTVPMEVPRQRALETVFALVGSLAGAFLLVMIVLNIMLGRLVIRPVTRMSEISEQVSLGDFSAPEYVKPGRDEIASLSKSFNRMRRSLDSAMKMLEDPDPR